MSLFEYIVLIFLDSENSNVSENAVNGYQDIILELVVDQPDEMKEPRVLANKLYEASR